MIYKKITLLSFIFLASCGGGSSNSSDENLETQILSVEESSQSTVFISKDDTQCNDDGLTLNETASFLTAANITVSASECGFLDTGTDLLAVCGEETNNIFIHTINTDDIVDAENLGFTDTSTLATIEASFQVTECNLETVFMPESSQSTVFISKGDTQCNDDGLTLDETAAFLTSANIAISESECGLLDTGISFATVCGAGTNNILIHTINTDDIVDAENLGFTETSTLAAREASFQVTECR